jgi:hypothetical protein
LLEVLVSGKALLLAKDRFRGLAHDLASEGSQLELISQAAERSKDGPQRLQWLISRVYDLLKAIIDPDDGTGHEALQV